MDICIISNADADCDMKSMALSVKSVWLILIFVHINDSMNSNENFYAPFNGLHCSGISDDYWSLCSVYVLILLTQGGGLA